MGRGHEQADQLPGDETAKKVGIQVTSVDGQRAVAKLNQNEKMFFLFFFRLPVLFAQLLLVLRDIHKPQLLYRSSARDFRTIDGSVPCGQILWAGWVHDH
jgi:hypothetical protein